MGAVTARHRASPRILKMCVNKAGRPSIIIIIINACIVKARMSSFLWCGLAPASQLPHQTRVWFPIEHACGCLVFCCHHPRAHHHCLSLLQARCLSISYVRMVA